MTSTLRILVFAFVYIFLLVAPAAAAELAVPQSLKAEHDAVVRQLERLQSRGGSIGRAASETLPLIKAHFAKEADFVFPPLSLLPDLAAGKITPEMKPAIAMSERTKAAQKALWDEHVQITTAMNKLITAAKAGKDQRLIGFATRVAAHSLNEVEVLVPAAILVGEQVRAKLAANR